MTGAEPEWEAANRDYLVAELELVRCLLRAHRTSDGAAALAEATAAVATAADRLSAPSRLDQVATGFGLSPFERSVLVLAAGPELVADLDAELLATGGRAQPSFGLALAVLPDPHWSALSPAAPLRRWNLVRLRDPAGPARSPLVIDERVLHHLVGAGHLDTRLAAVARPVPAPALPPPLAEAADRLVAAWRHRRPVLLHGPQGANVRAVAAAAAAAAGAGLLEIGAIDLPADAQERDETVRLMDRESVLAGWCWAVDVADVRADDAGSLGRALDRLAAPTVLLAGSGQHPRWGELTAVGVERLDVQDRRAVLTAALRRAGGRAAEVPVAERDGAAGVFDMTLERTEAAAADVAAGTPLWQACRRQVRRSFEGLAVVREPRACWDDLVLPAAQLLQLHAIVAAVRHRATVLDDWGFAARRSRGLGTTALFAGPSGTGKTLAAEAIACDLGLDLVQVDLSAVVSKYIGETEKNLAQLMDAAEDGGAVVLFDEADALFGRRSEVRDSHDRYANLEVGYLLQRMESFRGVAILTTNLRSVLDQAFLRRIQTIVSFPYPDHAARAAVWRAVFPPEMPLDDVDPAQWADVDLPGGGIAAAALTAAYLAAADGGGLRAEHLRTATRWELGKTSRVHVAQQPTAKG